MLKTKVDDQAQTRRLRLLLADGSPAVRQSLREELQRISWLEIVGEAEKSQEAIALLFQLRPDAVVVSASIADQGGFEVLRCSKHAFSNCAAILTSRRPDPFVTEAGRLLGAAGVCCTAGGHAQLLDLLRRLKDENHDGPV
jgi:DNA-binding NarL/FixJ family response regulator